jgi:VWFA-related protein
MPVRVLSGVVICALTATVLAAQQPTFRAGVELVELDAVVTDAAGNPVTNLTVDDFEVLEGGKPQPITAFSLVNIPVERAERALFTPDAIEPDVRSNQAGGGRVYLITLDEVQPLYALRARRFLRSFIENHFAANDIAGIAYIGRGSSNSQDFTSSKKLLLSAIDRYSGGFATSVDTNVSTALQLPDTGQGSGAQLPTTPRPEVSEASFELRQRMKTFRQVTEFLAGVRGRRKAMLLISTGAGMVDMLNVVDYSGGTMPLALADAHAAMQAATRGNVSIYPIDPRGLSLETDIESAESPTNETLQQRAADGLTTVSNMRAMANVTGGFAFVNQNRFEDAFERIVRENSAYYILGFNPTNTRRDGRYRRVQVRVKRPGLQVRSREGYVAPTGKAPAPPAARPATALAQPVADALASPTPNTGVPITAFAAAYKGSDRNASVVIVASVDPSGLDLVDKDGIMTGQLEIATYAASARDKMFPGDRHVINLALKPDTYERTKRDGFRVLTEMRLPAGRYQLRVAAGNRGDKAGSVLYDLEVPDFSKGLVMSGVALTSASSAAVPAARAKDPLSEFLPAPAITAREFAATDSLVLFAEVYDNERTATPHTVDLTATLRADDGRVVKTVTEQRSSTELQGSAGGYGFRPELLLAGTEPGIYVVRVEARVNAGERPTVSRDIQIRIR